MTKKLSELTPEQAARQRATTKRYRERQQDYFLAWRAEHKEQKQEYDKERRASDPGRYDMNKKRWYEDNKQEQIAQSRERREQNLEAYRAYHRERGFRVRYGITGAERDGMFAAQGSKCAGCGRDDAKSWHTDHCHTTGKVRGVLCRGCNVSLGLMRENPSALRSLAGYIEDQNARD